MPDSESLATAQRSVADPSVTHPLFPPLTEGCPETSTDEMRYPLEIGYDYDAVDPALFERPLAAGHERWAPLLPPLEPGTGLGEGNTPLVAAPEVGAWAGYDGDVYVKDESRNPTWSHKDRLNRCTVSAARAVGARGVAVSSSGNHGAAAAAYAARADLPCVVLTAPETPPAVQSFLRAYGAAVLAVDDYAERRRAVDRLAERGFHPASSRTEVHTGHPFGPEGYKPIAYETYRQLGAVPGTVFVPTGHAELLYGVWKGFRELAALGVADGAPAMVACEPAARGPLGRALAAGEETTSVPPEPTDAYAIKVTQSSYRGVRAVEESGGDAVAFEEGTLAAAQRRLARAGLWQEASGAAGVAGLRTALADGSDPEGPIVCIATSSGFKDGAGETAPEVGASWDAIGEGLAAHYDLDVDRQS